MNETGSPISVIDSAGMWRSNAARGYIDLAANVEANVKQLFRVDFDSESGKDVLPIFGLMVETPYTGRPGRSSHGYRGFCWPIPACLLSNSVGSG